MNKFLERICSTCSHFNKDAYRGANADVCYKQQTLNDKPVAVKVKPTQKACTFYRGRK